MAKETFTRTFSEKEAKQGMEDFLSGLRSMTTKERETYSKIELRTRDVDYTEAMSFEVYDPLWLLGRQWQFGRFKGNDCGSTVMTKIEVKRQKINKLIDKDALKEKTITAGQLPSFSTERPLEYDVERRPHEIDPFARIESALHFLKMKAVIPNKDAVLTALKSACPLDSFVPDKDEPLEILKARVNSKLDKLYHFYGNRCFDGYKLYQLNSLPAGCSIPDAAKVLQEYKDWFKKKYQLLDKKEDAFWNDKKLGYEVGLVAGNKKYVAENYHSGRLSWYSFDSDTPVPGSTASEEEVTLGVLSSPAVFPAAPNRRLWEFENRKVQFNDYRNDDTSALASSVIMQYTMMYSNDWMIVPLETEVGTVMRVSKLKVIDTFGQEFNIVNSFEEADGKADEVGFTDRWALFANSSLNAYAKSNFRTAPGLLCPPTLQRAEQGDPVEEVQFLRDEMANMLWGVEERVSDGCGGSLDSRSRSDNVFSIVDEERTVHSNYEKPTDADFSYLIQNRVPLHWIPFIPERIFPDSPEAKSGEIAGRDIILRRGRMPIWYEGEYQSVRPSSQLLAVKRQGGKVIPRYIYEEEVLGYGTKVGLYPQRTRWFNGTSFTWQGFEKKISGIQANSGLMFDALLDVEKKDEE
jgi:hypothetical protein